MLLKSFRRELFCPKCNPEFQSLHCHAHLDQDICAVLPYLNAELGGFAYTSDPPSLTLRSQGKLITLHPRLIAINALRDDAEADKILAWLQGEINKAWSRRDELQPSTASIPQPQVLEVLRLLPRDNCQQCGLATCLVFAVQAVQGVRGPADCPALQPEAAARLQAYLEGYSFD